MAQFSRFYTLLLIIISFLDFSCANIVRPDGGPKDIMPPKVQSAEPPNKSVNFKDNKIVLNFDELIDLKNPTQILVSPLSKKPPEVKIKGKSIILTFKDTLRNNTTYTVNFGESLRDYNEDNILRNYEYSFSTGPQLDTLSLTGKVMTATNNSDSKGILAALYESTAHDSLFQTQAPLYITRTNEKGSFAFNNIKAGSYKLMAIDDKNANYFFDRPDESIAFLGKNITLPDSLKKPYVLRMFSEGQEAAKVADRRNREYGKIEVYFTKPIDSLHLTALDSLPTSGNWKMETSPQHDTLLIWYRGTPDRASFSFALSGEKKYADTLKMRNTIKEETLQELKYTSSIRLSRSNSTLDIGRRAWIQFNHPIEQIDISRIQLLRDSIPITSSKQIYMDSLNPRRVLFDYAWQQDVNYRILLPDSIVKDFFGKYNDEILIKFAGQNETKYGTLLLNCPNIKPDKKYIFQLRDAKNDKIVVEGPLNSSKTEWKHILPGQYTIFLVEDDNDNGKWDTGNYKQQIQPELIYNTKQQTEIKQNWDTEVELKIDL